MARYMQPDLAANRFLPHLELNPRGPSAADRQRQNDITPEWRDA